LPFYLYSGAEWTCSAPLQKEPSGEDWFLAIQSFFLRELASHPWRVQDPAQAVFFVIPFDLEQSYFAGTTAQHGTHLNRVEGLLDALEQSEWYKRRGGADHFWSFFRWEM
ncbi:unnamed protein product, partial [Phaeothamnion confervicola]